MYVFERRRSRKLLKSVIDVTAEQLKELAASPEVSVISEGRNLPSFVKS